MRALIIVEPFGGPDSGWYWSVTLDGVTQSEGRERTELLATSAATEAWVELGERAAG